MSDTPRTDALALKFANPNKMIEHARQLERELAAAKEALRPFAALGGPDDGVMAAFHDMEDDQIVFDNSGKAITAGDVRAARKLLSSYFQPVATAMRDEYRIQSTPQPEGQARAVEIQPLCFAHGDSCCPVCPAEGTR